MYTPAHFAAGPALLTELLARNDFVQLVTLAEGGLRATGLPMLYEPGIGSHGALLGHVARNNDHWQVPDESPSLVIVSGPDAYISPSWYATKAEHGRVVPTWNYRTVHLHGRLRIHDDVEWLGDFVRRLTDHHESAREHPWSVDDAPEKFVAGQLRAIVGLELVIDTIEAKDKLSQNRSPADISGAVAGLADGAVADREVAAAMRRVTQPPTPELPRHA